MKLNTLRDLYIEQLQDLYSAETQLIKALPQMEKAATHPALKQAFNQHLSETEQHVRRLEQIFDQLGAKASGHTCQAMQGLIKEGQEMIKKRGEPATIDAGLIAAAQRVEHYEIAGYGCVRTYANQMGENKAASLLQQTLEEEVMTDQHLSELAEQVINLEAER